MHEIDRTIAAIQSMCDAGKRGVLVTIVATHGSTYRRAGARAVIDEDGRSFGLISGGCLERDLAERISGWLDTGAPQVIRYDTTQQADIVFGHGLGCRGVIDALIEPFDGERLPRLAREFRWQGREPVRWTTTLGERELLVEWIRPPHALLVLGGGLDAEPVARMAELVGWRTRLVTPREIHPDQIATHLALDTFDAAVVMTHNFLHDLSLLERLLPSTIRYVGLLGPRRRGQELLEQLGEVGTSWREKLHNPIGLDLGGETPEEIALAIVAEVQKVLNEREGTSLRQRHAPIHTAIAEGEEARCS